MPTRNSSKWWNLQQFPLTKKKVMEQFEENGRYRTVKKKQMEQFKNHGNYGTVQSSFTVHRSPFPFRSRPTVHRSRSRNPCTVRHYRKRYVPNDWTCLCVCVRSSMYVFLLLRRSIVCACVCVCVFFFLLCPGPERVSFPLPFSFDHSFPLFIRRKSVLY